MPRLSPSDVVKARKISKLLPLVLSHTRSLDLASRELGWIQLELPKDRWLEACRQRSRGRPLQYILGSQPFGELDVKCREGVLIPRWETEEWVLKLCNAIGGVDKRFRAMDICCGTGCIALTLKRQLGCEVVGVDISEEALELSRENSLRNGVEVQFMRCDVLSADAGDVLSGDAGDPSSAVAAQQFDLIVSNPPYISMDDYTSSEVAKSVKLYEPQLALVGGGEFYRALADIVQRTNAKGFMFELGYEWQYETTRQCLPAAQWECSLYYDSNGKPRCVVGWMKHNSLAQLSTLC